MLQLRQAAAAADWDRLSTLLAPLAAAAEPFAPWPPRAEGDGGSGDSEPPLAEDGGGFAPLSAVCAPEVAVLRAEVANRTIVEALVLALRKATPGALLAALAPAPAAPESTEALAVSHAPCAG